jgi:hypothetical protein
MLVEARKNARGERAAEVGANFDAVVVGAGFAGMYTLHRLRGLGLSARVYTARLCQTVPARPKERLQRRPRDRGGCSTAVHTLRSSELRRELSPEINGGRSTRHSRLPYPTSRAKKVSPADEEARNRVPNGFPGHSAISRALAILTLRVRRIHRMASMSKIAHRLVAARATMWVRGTCGSA